MTDGLPTLGTTGVTGVLGGRVAGELAAAGIHQRLLARSVSKAPDLPHAVVFPFSYSGVTHIVHTSFVGAAPDATFTLARHHYATEEHIKSSGLAYTFLRDNLYLDFMTTLVGEDGVILTHPGDHADRTYELTGPEALSMSEIAGILSEARGSRVTYHDETVSEAYASRARWGAPDWQTDAWVTTYAAIAAGDLARVSDGITAITGQPPLSLAQLLMNAADSS